eukprot:CAMPEP_0176413200 /NCGR_PEP_ID=MMETSP0127-20121128/4569_1 /TAXON_ID=938130 /ORGANISM="Platyophrya macrostoma, Strain WH" /LENGTH=527 /DNA_ID=CAMNT_0017792959 /DNA_START=36 /DNA_END=1619 /DNA_ORIENTATION=+
MKRHFGQYGELIDCVIMQDKNTGKFRGFGFVTFRNPDVINNVLLETHVIDGKTIDCKKALPRDHVAKQEPTKKPEVIPCVKTRKVFVGGLPHTITQESFNKFFSQFGLIESSSIMCDKSTGKARGFGFVIYTTEEAAGRVILNYNKNFIDGKWVECKEAVPKQKITTSKTDSDMTYSMTQGMSPDSITNRLVPQPFTTDGYNLTSQFTPMNQEPQNTTFEPQGNFSYQVRTVINPETFQKEQIVQLTNYPTSESKQMMPTIQDSRFTSNFQQTPTNYQQTSTNYQSTPTSYQSTTNSYQQTPTNSYQQTPTNSYQQTPTNSYQQTPTNSYQQTPTNSYQQTPTNSYQQTPTNSYQQTPTNSYQQTPSNYQQTPTNYQPTTTYNMQQDSSSYYGYSYLPNIGQTRTRNSTAPELCNPSKSSTVDVNRFEQKRFSISESKSEDSLLSESIWSNSPQRQESESQSYMMSDSRQENMRHSPITHNMRPYELPYSNFQQYSTPTITKPTISESLFSSVYQPVGKSPILDLDN